MAQYLIDAPAPPLPNLEFVYTGMDDPRAAFMLADLQGEYDRLYPSQARAAEEDKEINSYPASAFSPEEGGAFLLVLSGGEAVAGGALMRTHDSLALENSAEFKRIWTHPKFRGLGLSKYLLAELENQAARMGYDHVFLTTGPKQPVAVALYRATGYAHRQAETPAGFPFHAFQKPLSEHRRALNLELTPETQE